MRWARLRHVTLAELGCRSRHMAAMWADRLVPALGPAGAADACDVVWPAGGQDVPARRHLTEVVAQRFFPGAVESDTARVIRETCGAAADAVVAGAERLLEGRFDLLGYENLTFGSPINWHLDPVACRHVPVRHWSQLDPLDSAVVGDSKLVWELNRHQWLVTLAQASVLTGRPEFADRVFSTIDEWVEANPYGQGINWASSLEVSLRAISWCWTLMLLRDSPALTSARLRRIHRLLSIHAAHVERYLSYYFSPNTHLTGEALGLFYAGVLFAEHPDAARWRDTGRRILVAELGRQVADDGGYVEQASCYHRYTIEIYLHFALMAARNRIMLPATVTATVRRMLDWLLGMVQPDGTMPAIGDADGGWLMPLTRRAPGDPRGMLGLAAAVFDSPEYAWAAGPLVPEIPWMLGAEGAERFSRIAPRPPAAPASRVFISSGYAVMRSDWTRRAHQLILDAGPLGCPVSGAHGHADLLSVQCVAFGESFLVDPGTFCYAGDPGWRDYFRSTGAHSTIVIDRRSQADSAGPFTWRARPGARLRAWESTPDHDYAEAIHDGYTRLAQPVRHRRRVLFVKPHGWIVVDDLSGAGTHEIDLRFQFSPRPVVLVDGHWACARGAEGHRLWVCAWTSQALAGVIRAGREGPTDGWVSPAYGQRQAAPALIYSKRLLMPARITSLVLPVIEHREDTVPAVQIARGPEGVTAVRLPGDDRTIRVSADRLGIEHGVGDLRIA